MARDFNGSTDTALCATTISASLTTYTVAAWYNPDGTSANCGITVERNDGGGLGNPILFQLDQNTSSVRLLVRDDAGNLANATKTSALTAGVWHHICGTRDGNNVEVSTNGGTASTGTATLGTITPNTRTIGCIKLAAGYQAFADGKIAEVAVWNVKLTDAERVTLATGCSPLLVRPDSLLSYYPLIGKKSPETDMIEQNALTLSGTIASSHPRVFYPHRRQFRYGVTAAGGSIVKRLMMLGVGA